MSESEVIQLLAWYTAGNGYPVGPDGFLFTPREVVEFITARRNGTKL